jgi:hypothetical protein
MFPQWALRVAMDLQIERVRRALISATPQQRFTSHVDVDRTPRPHRVPRPQPRPHGTVSRYVHHACRCRLCATANAVYHQQRRQYFATSPEAA